MSAAPPLARLREALLPDTDVLSALLCTYGLDPRFFEAEVLPALLPTRLFSDVSSGSLAGYLFEADEATAQTPVEVFYDHITDGEGGQLHLAYQRVDLGSRAFHPKLIVAEYEDRLRVIVSSANLTRPAWTSLFELFVVDDLVKGEPHGWTAGLRTFIPALRQRTGYDGRAATRILARLEDVGEAPIRTLHHSFDARLLDAAFPPVASSAIDVVSPFFEGEDGPGLFDELRKRYPSASLRLFLAASEAESGYVVVGPPDKLNELRGDGADLQLVRPSWEGDDDRAPDRRGLHGKLLAVELDGHHHVAVGSANATRAALRWPVDEGGNAELIVTASLTPRAFARLLPSSFAAPDDVTFEAADHSGEDEDPGAEAASYVRSATYSAVTGELTLVLTDAAHVLTVTYGGTTLGTTEGREWSSPLMFGADTFVTVSAGHGPAIVPVIVLDPERMAPRGAPTDLDLEALADLLAGHRQLTHAPGSVLPTSKSAAGDEAGTPIFGRGAIPWRRILAGLRGLQDDLTAQLPSPEATAWTLENPLRFGGLLDRFVAAHEAGRFLDGDFAFALHQARSTLDAVHRTAREPEFVASGKLLERTRREVQQRLDDLLTGAGAEVRGQIEVLERTQVTS